MFCNNCGNKLDENSMFCPVCGNRIENGTVENAEVQTPNLNSTSNGFTVPTDFDSGDMSRNNVNYESDTANEVNSQPVEQVQTTYTEDPQPGFVGGVSSEHGYSKPKSKKMKVILASIASVLVVTIVAGIIWWDDISFNLFASSDEKFQTIQADSVESLVGSMAGTLNTVSDVVEVVSAVSGNGEISDGNVLMGMNGASIEIKLGKDIKENLIDSINDSITDAAMYDIDDSFGMVALDDIGLDLSVIDSSVIEWIDSIGIDGEVIIDKKAFSIDYGYTLNSVDIAKAQCTFEYDGGNLYLSAPGLLEKSLVVEGLMDELDIDFLASEFEQFAEMLKIIPDEDVIESLANKYIKCIINAIDDVKETSQTVTVNGVSQKLSVYSVTIDEEDVVNIIKALMKQVRDDKQLHQIIVDVAEFAGEDGNEIVDMLVESVDEGLQMMNSTDMTANMPPVDIEVKLYADGREAVGMSVAAEDVEMSYLNVTGSGKVATELMFVTPDGEFGFSGSGKKSGEKVDGEYSINIDGQDIVKFTTKGLDMNKLSQGDLEGSITVSLSEDIKNISSMFGDFGEFLDYSIVLTGKSEGNNAHSFDISLNNGKDELVVGLKATTRKDSKKGVTIPDKNNCLVLEEGDDIDDEIMDIFTPETLIDRLKEAGMPSKYIDLFDNIKELV